MLPDQVTAALRELPPPVCAYVYDRSTLRAQAAALRAALPPTGTLLYAMKANSHPEVVAALTQVCDGLEVASGGELALARTAGAGRIVFGGPAKTDAELAAAVSAATAGVDLVVNVESDHELRRLDLVARTAGTRARAALRVNRRAGTPAGSHRMTGAPTPFGIDEEQLPTVTAVAADLPGVELVGFHLHAVSNQRDATAHARFLVDAAAWAVAAADRHRLPLRYLNLGGGLGVDYTGGTDYHLATFAAGLAAAAALLPADTEVVIEPGRLLTADAGWYAAEVLDLKSTHGRWFAVLRGGTHHFRLPAAWGYDHPFHVLPTQRWDYPFPRPEVRDVAVDAVGELCTPRDVLCRGHRVTRLRIGDLLVFGRTGAYGWDISHREFLRHPYPQLLVI